MTSTPLRTRVLPDLQRSYAEAVPALSVPWPADALPDPRLVWLDEPLAVELGLDPEWLRSPEGIALLTGSVDAEGHPVTDPARVPAAPTADGPTTDGAPFDPAAGLPGPADPDAPQPFTTAQAYAGHQFGQPRPALGDGRAVLLGELVDVEGRRRDLHLKGAGRTPFARAGDGRAPLGAMLREAVVSSSMHALGIPTTRALAVLSTGERIAPRRGVTPEPGGLLVRVAASHLRVGTLEYAAWHHDLPVRRSLLDHVMDRHHPAARDTPNPPLALLEAVTRAQAELVADWMVLGFVHGVMNTDNVALSGEGIDYGPCAYVDRHRRDALFSSIDRQGRYAYGNQPAMALWNLSRCAEALLELIDPERPDAAVDAATAVLERFEPWHREALARRWRDRFGLAPDAPDAAVTELGLDLSAVLEGAGLDHTRFHRALADGGDEAVLAQVADGDPAGRDALAAWLRRRAELRPSADGIAAAEELMRRTNPVVIPRNAHLDAALTAAVLGDLGPVTTLLAAVRDPFTVPAGAAHLAGPGEGGDELVTYCGT